VDRSDFHEHANIKARSGYIQRGASIGSGRLDTPFREETDKGTITQSKGWLGVEMGFESEEKSSSGASTPPLRQLDARPITMAPHPRQVTPGSFPVGGGDSNDLQDEVASASIGPALHGIEAELVDPERQQQVIEQRLVQELEAEHQRAQLAEIISEDELRTCRWRRVVGVVGFVLVAFAIALAVALTRPSPTVETQAPTAAPTFPPTPQEIIDLIQPHSFDDGASLYDTSSPQSAAARWLADDDYLETYSTQRMLQRYALVTLYHSTNGDEWHDKQDWMTDKNECQWLRKAGVSDREIECDAESGITEFNIDKNNLDGTLPEEIAFLSNSLFSLEVKANSLQGDLPSTLGLLTKLVKLELAENRFTSRIPTEVGRLTLLQEWTIAENNLTAPIPSEIGFLTKLQEFHAEENGLTGHVPTELGLLADLKTELTLAKNNFTGPIPSELGLLTKLRTLELGGNGFESAIPTEVGFLAQLEKLILSENQLTGPLPSELGRLSMLGEFHAHKNRLGSRLPTELGLLTTIRHSIQLGENGFIGPIPSELGVLTNLERLGLGRTNITGTIPSSIAGFSNLQELVLHNNELTGTIPIILYNLHNLRKIHLYNNSFSGPFTCPTQVMDCYVSCFIPDNASCRILPP
jgi:Leucine-rich repeat (LRR) protein